MNGSRRGEISVSLDPSARGRGLGVELIARATERAARELDLDVVVARIKETNVTSRRAFTSAGYVNSGLELADAGVVALSWSPAAP